MSFFNINSFLSNDNSKKQKWLKKKEVQLAVFNELQDALTSSQFKDLMIYRTHPGTNKLSNIDNTHRNAGEEIQALINDLFDASWQVHLQRVQKLRAHKAKQKARTENK